jgi:hypothetical protein
VLFGGPERYNARDSEFKMRFQMKPYLSEQERADA